MAMLGRRAAYDEPQRAVQAIDSGQRVEVVAEVLGVARSTVFGWAQAARMGGATNPLTHYRRREFMSADSSTRLAP